MAKEKQQGGIEKWQDCFGTVGVIGVQAILSHKGFEEFSKIRLGHERAVLTLKSRVLIYAKGELHQRWMNGYQSARAICRGQLFNLVYPTINFVQTLFQPKIL